ncbi:MAG: SGNH/GDSL hydrolase family protein [Verrucomicrobiota bacterium]
MSTEILDVAEQRSFLRIEDIKGSYTIPHIQSSSDLDFEVTFQHPSAAIARVELLQNGSPCGTIREVTHQSPMLQFQALAPGEYDICVSYHDEAGGIISQELHRSIAIGTVIGAIGDSITEGYHSKGYWRDNLDLTAADFPSESVSKDGRNFPQFSPTTYRHRPEINCYASWMPRLNDLLSAQWQHPVFIANEGWGGIDTARYLEMMKSDLGWQSRMQKLQPSLWLIHLGVNDERAQKAPAEVAANLHAIIDLLICDHAAEPSRIFLATPSYDYAPDAESYLAAYREEIIRIIDTRGLRRGPDFFSAYSKDKELHYGEDPVHPNEAGMKLMADLWAEALLS